MVGSSLAALCLLFSTGCDRLRTDQKGDDLPSQAELDQRADSRWRDAPEQSKFYVDDDYAVRCWREEQGYDCLQTTGDAFFIAIRFHASSLPRRITVLGDQPQYHCGFNHTGLTEIIFNSDGQLLKREQGFGEFSDQNPEPWNKLSTDEFAADNSFRLVGKYLNCPLVRKLVVNGSLAALGTTLLVHEELDHPVVDYLSEEDESAALRTVFNDYSEGA